MIVSIAGYDVELDTDDSMVTDIIALARVQRPD